MLLLEAIDEFILCIEIEKNYSVNTVYSYSLNLKMFHDFLVALERSLHLNDINKSIVRRFIQEKVQKIS